MTEYTYENNIDSRVIAKTADILAGGGLVALPTDTSWLAVCSLSSKEGIKRLRGLSGERDERHFTLLCSSISQIGQVCALDNTRFRLIKRLTPGPYVFILRSLLGTEKALDIKRREVGVRISGNLLPRALVDGLGSPLYSVTAKRTMIAGNDAAAEAEFPHIPEEELFEGGWELEALEGLDLIIDDGIERPRRLSTVLDLTGDEASLIRAGAGDWPV